MEIEEAVVLRNDSLSIKEAAQTINQAFSDDPLIKWLRPRGMPWAKLDPASLKWQRRRIKRSIHEDLVLSLVRGESEAFEDQKGASDQAFRNSYHSTTEFGAIAMVSPPQKITYRSKLCRVWSWIQLQFLDLLDPVEDEGADDERVKIMMKSHEAEFSAMKQQLSPRTPWYVEVIAIRPSLHGQGLGGKLLKLIVDMSKGDPIVLECTDEKTVGFYQKFGFEVVKQVKLECPNSQDAVSLFLMLRQ